MPTYRDDVWIGTIISPVPVIGTIATVQSPVPVVGTVATVQSMVQAGGATGVVVATVSGTLNPVGGTIYGWMITNPSNATGTVLLIQASGTKALEMIAPATQTQYFSFHQGFVYTGSLQASLMGTLLFALFQ